MPANLFQVSGLGSGVDTGAILDALRQFKMRPALLEQKKQDTYAARQRAWQDINARLLSVKSASESLSQTTAFSAMKAASADAATVGVTADATAAAGSFGVNVTGLAQSRKVVSATFAGASQALGLAGDFTVNGKAVRVTAADTLDDVAKKINALGAGATAAVVQIAPGSYRMTVGGTATGLRDSLSLASVGAGSTSLNTLGLVAAAGAAQNRYQTTGPAGTTAASAAFSSGTDKLGAALGLAAEITNGSFTVNGHAVAYDTAQDTLASLATRINALAEPGLTAAVVADGDNGGRQRLQVTGASGAPVFVDGGDGLLGMIGMTQKAADPGNVIGAAADATFTIDGLAVSRPTNTAGDVLSGVTLSLQKVGATTVSISRDTQGVVDGVNRLVSVYNDTLARMQAQSRFPGGDASKSPPLFGDYTLQQVQDDLIASMMTGVSGLPDGFATLADIGIKMGMDNKLSVDADKLTAALLKDPQSVSRMFTLAGAATHADVGFVAAGADTRSTGRDGAGYGVTITVAAQRASVTGGSVAADPVDETLTFGGALFKSPVTVAIGASLSLAQVASAINDSAAGALLEAFDDNGALGLRSKAYGSGQSFTVVSDVADGASGIGDAARAGTGVDVAGSYTTPDGRTETATGRGQVLTGSQQEGATRGLIVTVKAAAPGSYGTVTVQRGAAASVQQVIARLTDFTTGALKLEQDALQQRINDSQKRVDELSARVDASIARMQAQFTRMESQVSRFRSQSTQLSQTIASLPKWSKE